MSSLGACAAVGGLEWEQARAVAASSPPANSVRLGLRACALLLGSQSSLMAAGRWQTPETYHVSFRAWLAVHPRHTLDEMERKENQDRMLKSSRCSQGKSHPLGLVSWPRVLGWHTLWGQGKGWS